MKKYLLIALVVVLSFSMVLMSISCKEEETAGTDVEVSEETEEMEESSTEELAEITVRLWFWGEDEAPGLTDWLNESAELYNEMHPNVTVENTLLMIDAIYPSFEAAIAADDPPDLHMLWGGALGLYAAWGGSVVPWDDYWTEEELSLIYDGTRGEGYWDGKQWCVPLYIDPWLAAINKDIWVEAGLDPDNIPSDWDGFVEALEAIKAAGYIPWTVGIKDGYYGSWFPSLMQYQEWDTVSLEEYGKAIIGEQKLTDENQSGWWYDIQTLRDKGLFNDDATSLTLAEGNDMFLEGKVGFVLGVQPLITYYIDQMGEEVVGAMIAPSSGTGDLRGYMPVPAGAEMFIPHNAKYKEEATDFMRFLYTEERQNALHTSSGAFGGSKSMDPSVITSPQNQFIYDKMINQSCGTYNFTHPAALEEALYSIGQLFMANEIDAAEAAQMFEDAAVKWRENSPEELENFKSWFANPFKP